MILLPDELQRFGVGNSNYLLMRSSEHYLILRSDRTEEERIYSGDTVNIADLGEIELYNPHPSHVTFEVQFSQRQITQLSGGESSISGSINEIKGVVHTEAQTNGVFNTPPWVTVDIGQTVQLSQSNETRRELIIQNVSQVELAAHIGDNNVDDQSGLILIGQKGAPQALILDTSGDVFAYNPSDTHTLTLSVNEVAK